MFQHNHRRMSVISALLIALASNGSASSVVLNDSEQQELARLALTLHHINTTDSWAHDISRFISAYTSKDEKYLYDLLIEKEKEIELVQMNTRKRRLMEEIANLKEHSVDTSMSRQHSLRGGMVEASNDRELLARAGGLTSRPKPKVIQNGRTNNYYSRPSNNGLLSSNQYTSTGYYSDPYSGKAAKAVRHYSAPVQNSHPNNYNYPIPGKSAKAMHQYSQLAPMTNTYPESYVNLGYGYYMYNGLHYYYDTPVMCWYEGGVDNYNDDREEMMYYRTSGVENRVKLRRRQPTEYSVQGRYESSNRRYGENDRDLHWSYSPNYFQSSSSSQYYIAKAGKSGKSAKSKSSKSKSSKTGVHWLYPYDPMYSVICLPGLLPQEDDYYYYDDEYNDDTDNNDNTGNTITSKPTRRPTPNKTTKKPTRRPRPEPNPTTETPQPTQGDLTTPVPTTSDDNTSEVRCPNGCPDCEPDSPLPCPPPEMKRICDKDNEDANFIDCYQMCKPSFCCIHDSISKEYSPSCSDEYENCFLYYPCYIIWWKLSDTIGPATYLRVEQDEEFYNVDFSYLENDWEEDQIFFQQLFGHHFDVDDAPTDETFENEENW
eukprot:scaffold593_cov73-Cyclotella_meneghiniana.AAC.3